MGKSKEVQDITLIHKTRKNTIRDRIQKTNSMMSSLYEYGYVTELSKSKFCKSCKNEVEQAHEEGYISEQAYKILLIDCKEIEELCKKEKELDSLIAISNKLSSTAKRLQKILGIGPINASCLSIAPISSYENPRDFAASLGLVPRQNSSGGKEVLGGISKQGDRYARTMLIQAGRTIAIRAMRVKETNNVLVKWAQKKFAENKPFNVVCVGLANKLARIAHSIVVNETEYRVV
jgi:transposase